MSYALCPLCKKNIVSACSVPIAIPVCRNHTDEEVRLFRKANAREFRKEWKKENGQLPKIYTRTEL